MSRSIKSSIITLILLSSLIPLIIFAGLFFNNTFSFFIANDKENIESVLEKEKKYIEKFVDVNIKDVRLVSTSDNVKTLKREEIIDVFMRVMKVRDDFEKMKFITKNGDVIEVSRDGKIKEYKKTKLDYFDKYALEQREIAFYTNEEDNGEYLCFASAFVRNYDVYATIIAYMPTKTVDFFTNNINLDAIGEIYITDKRDKFLIKKSDIDVIDTANIQMPIKNSDWTLVAKINNKYFMDVLLRNVLVKIILFLIFIMASIIPVANYIAIQVQGVFEEILDAVEKGKKIEGKNANFYKIYEFKLLKITLNKLLGNIKRF